MRYIIFFLLLLSNPAWSGSVEKPAADHSPEAQLAAFEVTEGYEISLFASEENQIANPIAMHFDGKDRLWVLCSLVYPQLVPTEKADDKIYILEDTDNDGRADKTIVFAEGLNMPTGFVPGDGGVYVGEGSDLVFLKDTDGDDKADSKKVIFSGFGTNDTHQNINSFTWTPDGELLYCQGLHAFSRIETPWGIKKLDEHGVWRMRPRRLQLDPFRGVAGQNPWGIAFGHWGEGFVKGNGTSISELTPVAVPTLNRANELEIGKTAIKAMGALVVDSPALPDDIQGDILIAGYYAHVIDRMKLYPDSSGHRTENVPPLFRTDHSSFRPVDIKTGPDGAIYIADWYNPIIGHYQASLRHPDRDKVHGRIWRVTAKNHDLLERPNLASLSIETVVSKLGSPIRYERDRAREILSEKPTKEVIAALDKWTTQTDDEHHLYEALCVYAWHETVNPGLLERLHKAKDPLARAFAARVAGRWQDRLPKAESYIAASIHDPHPRVRLEAIVAAGYSKSPALFAKALEALDHPVDRFIDTALAQISYYQKPVWFPALKAGTFQTKKPEHLAFALQTTAGSDAAGTARTMLADPQFESIREILLILLSQSRKPTDQVTVLTGADGNAKVLEALADAVALHKLIPKPIPVELETIIKSDKPETRAAAIRLAGLWKVKDQAAFIAESLQSENSQVRNEAVAALGKIKGAGAIETITKAATQSNDASFHQASLDTLAALDTKKAAALAAALVNKATTQPQLKSIVTPFIRKTSGLDMLAAALESSGAELTPEQSGNIRTVIGNAGAYSAKLDAFLGANAPGDKIGIPEYSEGLIAKLASEVKKGDPDHGKQVFQNGAISCIGCHQVGNQMASLGPDLSAVGAGLPVELIIEAILWPRRQVKEGFLSSVITTKSGQVISGYIQKENKQRVSLRDAATGAVTTIAGNDIAARVDAGTLMPPGLTANLSREELIDMVAYLTTLKGK
ncbi:MAG: HEAT repeat domain-containing protein [Verrucomicrobiales bacterium]|nr:HEAT repeat domain-containing protein [Verrucomicrobiales bacterium]